VDNELERMVDRRKKEETHAPAVQSREEKKKEGLPDFLT